MRQFFRNAFTPTHSRHIRLLNTAFDHTLSTVFTYSMHVYVRLLYIERVRVARLERARITNGVQYYLDDETRRAENLHTAENWRENSNNFPAVVDMDDPTVSVVSV